MAKLDGMMYAILCIIVIAIAVVAVWRLVSMMKQSRNEKKSANNQQSSYVQLNVAAKQAEASSVSEEGYRIVKGFLVKLDTERQNRHMPGRNAYEMARTNGNLRSIIYRDATAIQKLLDDCAGTGEFIGADKEIVNFGQVIGQYVDVDGQSKRETKMGVIHYSAEGAYIVPCRPY
ncbi:MAG: hypothetical protein E7292_05350 [Lachnospiraceae bacterium]|nr:hypothetical protein [Lachnospiraceae bacterium]